MSQNQGPGTQNNSQGIPSEGHGGKNFRGSGGGGSPQNNNTKGNGAQKRKLEKKR